jgi:hypothetical protein
MELIRTLSRLIGTGPAPASADITRPDRLIQGSIYNDEPIPTYPDETYAIPLVPPEQLLETQSDLMGEIQHALGFNNAEAERLFIPCVLRFIAYAHLMPASEEHHHCGQGGLLRHSLETAYYASRLAEGMVFAIDHDPVTRKALDPRYRLALVLAALLHDVGKPLVDIGAVAPDRDATWSPHADSLYAWGKSLQLSHYKVYWRPGARHKRHEVYAVTVLREILGTETLRWLAECGGDEILDRMIEALVGGEASDNPIAKAVKQADSASVDKDLAEGAKRVTLAGGGGVHKQAVRLVHQIQKALREDMWQVNAPGAMIWHTREGTYASHPQCLKETAQLYLQERNAGPGMPTDPNVLLRMLEDAHMIETNIDALGGSSPLWDVTVQLKVGQQVTEVQVQALRFARADLVFGDSPSPTPINLVVEGDSEADEQKEDPDERQESSSEPVGQKAESEPPASASEKDTPAADTTSPQDNASPNQDDSNDSESGAKAEVVVRDRRNERDVAESRSVEVNKRRKAPPERPTTTKESMAWLKRNGKAGHYLQAVVDRLRIGDRARWKESAIVQEGLLYLQYPHAFEGMGISHSKVQELFSGKGWLIMDTANGNTVTHRINIAGLSAQCLAFNDEVTDIINQLTTEADAANYREPVAASPEDMARKLKAAFYVALCDKYPGSREQLTPAQIKSFIKHHASAQRLDRHRLSRAISTEPNAVCLYSGNWLSEAEDLRINPDYTLGADQ